MNGDENELDPTGEHEEEEIDLGELGSPAPTEPPAPVGEETDYKVELAKSKARADALAEEVERLNQRSTQAPGEERRPAPTAPPARKTLRDLLPADFDSQVVNDTPNAIKNLLDTMDAEMDRRTSQAGIPAAVTQGISLVEGYLQRKRADDPEEYALAFSHFNEKFQLAKRENPNYFAQLANASPQVLDDVMDEAWFSAVGKGERQKRAAIKADAEKRRAAAPPNLGGSGSPAAPAAGGRRLGTLSPVEQAMVRNGKAAGLSDDDCKDIIREWRREQRGA